MVGNLVSGKRIAQASGRDLGQIEDNDQARKVSVLGMQTVGRVAVAQTGGRSRDWQAGGWCLGSSPWACLVPSTCFQFRTSRDHARQLPAALSHGFCPLIVQIPENLSSNPALGARP